MSRYLRIVLLFAKLEAQFELAYRTNFLFDLLQQVVITFTSLGAVFILFSYTDTMNGWTLPAMIVVVGVFYIVQGVGDLVFLPSAQQLMEHVRLGTLDFVLLKPVDAQFFVSLRRIKFTSIVEIVLGVGIVVAGFTRLGAVDLVAAALFVITLACGLVLVYVLLLVLGTLAFWFVRVENLLVVYEAFTDAARFPIDIYPYEPERERADRGRRDRSGAGGGRPSRRRRAHRDLRRDGSGHGLRSLVLEGGAAFVHGGERLIGLRPHMKAQHPALCGSGAGHEMALRFWPLKTASRWNLRSRSTLS